MEPNSTEAYLLDCLARGVPCKLVGVSEPALRGSFLLGLAEAGHRIQLQGATIDLNGLNLSPEEFFEKLGHPVAFSLPLNRDN